MTTAPPDPRSLAAPGTVVAGRDGQPVLPPPPAPAPTLARQAAGWVGGASRALRGWRFPVATFAAWRLVQLAFLWVHQGALVETAYRYDGAHYLRILHYGYWHPRPLMPSHAFFPGVAWVAEPVHWLTGSDAITVHVVATATALAAFVTVWGVTRAWRDEATARVAVVLLAVFPSSIFLWSFYSEALFIALGAGGVWADRRGRRWVAAACFAGLATTRSVGILVPAVVVLARVVRQRGIDRWAVGYAAAAAAGFAAVLATMWRQVGDPLAWVGVQGDWGRYVAWPWVSVLQGIDNLYPKPGTEMVPTLLARELDLWCVPIALVAIGYAAFSRRDRFPMEAWVLGVALIGVQLASSVLASFNRFVLADWVIYPVYAAIALRLPPRVRWPVLGAVAAIALWTNYALVSRLALNRFIG